MRDFLIQNSVMFAALGLLWGAILTNLWFKYTITKRGKLPKWMINHKEKLLLMLKQEGGTKTVAPVSEAGERNKA